MKKQTGDRPDDFDKIVQDGFSSDEELQHEQIIIQEPKKQQVEHVNREEVKFKLPPPQQITDKSYSLRPDIQTGWNHKSDLPSPIPIIFDNCQYDSLIKCMLKHPKQKVKICYLGPRYQNTYYSWYDKQFNFPYHHIKAPNDMKFTNRPFCGQHWQAEDDLLFDSFFEGGNLDSVMKVGQRQYDCFMRVDSNTAGHLQWFNFKVKGWKKMLKYKINICNFQKDKCLFARGMKPYIFSAKKKKHQKIDWRQDGENVRFQKKVWLATKIYEHQIRTMYRLSFQYYTSYQQDQIQIAYCIPYTYSRVAQLLKTISSRPQTKDYFKVTKLCNSLGGLEIPLMIVHQGLEEETQIIDQYNIPKKCVVISGRAHPGQSNGSHMIQGFIKWLCGTSNEAAFLRKYIVFKIVPMLNPDGVALGNYRTGLSGKDFNRQYRNPDKIVFPQVYHFKKLVAENKNLFGDRLLMFLDFHGHSTKKNTFVYGPQFPIIQKFYYESRIFPKLIGNATPMFRYYSCSFKISQVKVSTARAILLRKLNIPLSYTIQTSNGSYFDYQKLQDMPYDASTWSQMGLKIGQALYQYVQILVSVDKARIEKIKNKTKNKQKQKRPGKNKKSGSLSKTVQKVSIFSSMENQKIRNLFQEIKQAEEKREEMKVSDDEMSEGSSDREGQDNDLAPDQANFLFNAIKRGQFESLSRCRLRRKTRSAHSRANRDKIAQQKNQDKNIQQIQSKDDDSSVNQQILIRKKQIHIRKVVPSRMDQITNFQPKNNKTTAARIINFSFGSQSPRHKEKGIPEKSKATVINKLNFLQLVSGKWSEENSRRDPLPLRNKVVIDLSSDPHFRKTYHSGAKQKIQREPQKLLDIGQQTGLPFKRGRFQHYKYRRMLLNND